MKAVYIVLFAVLVSSMNAFAEDVYVRGYTRSNGTYVEPHHRSAPDSTRDNNYSTQGNTNPYTGRSGTEQGGSNNSYGNPYGNRTR
jgi:hypothetical protein